MMPGGLLLLVTILSTASLSQMVSGCGRGRVFLRDNGYRRLLVSIDDEVQESPALLQRITGIFTNASRLLYQMSRQRAYFEDVHILIPESWPDNASYAVPTWQEVDQSEVTVGPLPQIQDYQVGADAPFTIRTTPCGELGYLIHLTPQFLLNDTVAAEFGPREKVFLHEWSHLRYGVFDEYSDGIGKSDFYAADNGELEGVRCPSQLKGEMWDAESQSPRCNFQDGQPDENCRFKPDMSSLPQNSASLMFHTRSEQVNEWCDDDVTRPETLHNREARSEQNKQCGGKSVWEVLRNHGDFRDGQNPPSTSPAPKAPRFTLVKRRSKRTVFVLDVSGSMETNDRIKLLGQAFSSYLLRVAEDGEEVGIVWFEETASVKANLTQINSHTRRELLRHVPTIADGGTSIGDGLVKGVEVLQGGEGGHSEGGGIIILLSDGEETNEPYIRDVASKIVRSNARVHTIAVSKDADASLELIAKETGGLSFSYADTTPSNALNDAFLAIASAGLPLKQKKNLLHSETIQLDAGLFDSTTFVVDNTTINSVTLSVGYTGSVPPDVRFVCPSGRVITSSSPEYESDTKFNTVSISLGHVSEVGVYQMNVTNSGTETQTLFVTVTSKVTEGENAPVIVRAQWRHQSVNNSATQQAIYVSVSKGYAPMLHAVVKATVENPFTSSSNPMSSELTPLDNGAGSDVKKDDGVYSSYVTTYTTNGRYNVKVVVRDSTDTVISDGVVGVGVPPSAARFRRDPDHSRRSLPASGPFQRVASGGSFVLRNFDASLGDMFPPSRISDLEVGAVTATSVTLEWTAPGNDLDHGTAAGYVLKMATEFEALYSNHTQASNVSDQHILAGSLTSPQSSGSRENITVHVSEGAVTYYFIVQAYDNSSNTSPPSNIVSATTAYAAKDQPSDQSSSHTAVIIGIVCGIAGLLIIVAVIAVVGYRRRSRTKNLEQRRNQVF